jgi:hypothetical protein
VLQQFVQCDVAVKRPAEQRLDRGGLKQLVWRVRDVDPLVAEQVDVQRREEFELAYESAAASDRVIDRA